MPCLNTNQSYKIYRCKTTASHHSSHNIMPKYSFTNLIVTSLCLKSINFALTL